MMSSSWDQSNGIESWLFEWWVGHEMGAMALKSPVNVQPLMMSRPEGKIIPRVRQAFCRVCIGHSNDCKILLTQIFPCLAQYMGWRLAWNVCYPSPSACKKLLKSPSNGVSADPGHRLHLWGTAINCYHLLLCATWMHCVLLCLIWQSWKNGSDLQTCKDSKRKFWTRLLMRPVEVSTFNLVKFGKMGTVDGFISEDSVYAEVLGWLEAILS